LAAKVVASENDYVERGAEALVAREHPAVILPRCLEQLIAVHTRVVKHIGTEQPKPSREPGEHAIGGESWRVDHHL